MGDIIEVDFAQADPLQDFSVTVLKKAQEIIEKDGIHRQDMNRWEVDSSWRLAPKKYIVTLGDGYRACTCAHGKNNPGRAYCAHVAAATALKEEL